MKNEIVLFKTADGEFSMPVRFGESRPEEKEMMVNLVMNFLA